MAEFIRDPVRMTWRTSGRILQVIYNVPQYRWVMLRIENYIPQLYESANMNLI